MVQTQESQNVVAQYAGGSRSGFSSPAYVIAKVAGTESTGTMYQNQYICITMARTVSLPIKTAFARSALRYSTQAEAESNCFPVSALTTDALYVLPRTKTDCAGAASAAAAGSAAAALLAVLGAVLTRRQE